MSKRAMNNWKPLRRVKGALGHARRKDRETRNLCPSSWRRKFASISSRGMWKVRKNIASIVGIFILGRRCTILTFSTVKPQLACHWSVGKVFSSNRMLRTRGNRESLSRNGSHFVARCVRLRCYFWHYFILFQVFSIPPSELCKLCNFNSRYFLQRPLSVLQIKRWPLEELRSPQFVD